MSKARVKGVKVESLKLPPITALAAGTILCGITKYYIIGAGHHHLTVCTIGASLVIAVCLCWSLFHSTQS